MPQTKQKPAAEKADRKPQPTPALKSELKLTEFQTFVCDQVGDLILNGGHTNELTNLLYAAMGHYYRTMFPREKTGDCVQQEEDAVTKFIEGQIDNWERKLTRQWPAPEDKKTEPEVEVDDTRAIERVYATLRRDLRERFEEFMNEAGGHDKYLLRDVLMDWEGSALPLHCDDPEGALATAFTYRISDPHTYFKVPDELKDMVEKYIKLLRDSKGSKPETA